MSHWMAFVFHRKAYEDRLQTLEKELGIIDHLRTHRPKRISNVHNHGHRSSGGFFGTMGFGWGSSVGIDSGGNPTNRSEGRPNNRFSKLVGTPMSSLLGTPAFEKAGFNFGGGTTGQGTTLEIRNNGSEKVTAPSSKRLTRPVSTPASMMSLLPPEEETANESHSSLQQVRPLSQGFHQRTTESEDDKKDRMADSEHGFDTHNNTPRVETQTPTKAKSKRKRSWFHRLQRHYTDAPTESDEGDRQEHMKPNSSKDPSVAEAIVADHPYKPAQPLIYSREASSDTFHVPNEDMKVKSKTKLLSPESGKSDTSDFVQAARVLKSAVLYDARNIKGKEEDLNGGHGWGSIGNAREAKVSRSYQEVTIIDRFAQRLARTIYTCFKPQYRHRNYLVPSDFYPAYVNHVDAEAAFKVFDKDGNGDISRAEVKSTVWRIYKERRALVRSLRDAENALRTLDWIMMVFATIIVFFSRSHFILS